MAAPSGLSAAEVAERRARYGPNALPQTRYRLVRLILRQFRGIFNLLLLGAAAVTFALGEPIDGAFILFFVFLGTGLNVFQEYKSNAAADKLKTYLLNTVTVIRDGIDQEVAHRGARTRRYPQARIGRHRPRRCHHPRGAQASGRRDDLHR